MAVSDGDLAWAAAKYEAAVLAAQAGANRAEAQLAACRALLEEAWFHVTVERDEHSIHDCSHCDLSTRIEAPLAELED